MVVEVNGVASTDRRDDRLRVGLVPIRITPSRGLQPARCCDTKVIRIGTWHGAMGVYGQKNRGVLLVACVVGSLVPGPGTARGQLRVAEWNVTNYASGRVNEFQTAIYDSYAGRSMTPDIIIAQEFLHYSSTVTNFKNLLNSASGSPGDWQAAPIVDGPDTDNAFFYRTSKVTFLGVTTVSWGGPAPNHPRNVERYDIRLAGYSSAGAVLACYSSHMKAGSSGGDQDRRLVEALEIRADAETLPAQWHFLLGADLNIQASSQDAYQELVASQGNDAGRFFDPISTPGTWNNNSFFRFVHTQDPIGAGGMDDRHDQILLSAGLIDGDGFDYIGNPAVAYSTSTWNDANHSYRAWGNDGTSFNDSLTITGNTMVGATIAQALVDSALSGGHLPVFLDLQVPPEVDSSEGLNFGIVAQGAAAEQMLTVLNDGDVALWNAEGIADLVYTLQTTAGFSAPGGSFAEPAGDAGNEHPIAIDTSTTGLKVGTLTIYSNAPDQPVREVFLIGTVVHVLGDVDLDGDVDLADQAVFVDCQAGPNVGTPPPGDCTQDQFDLLDSDLDPDGDVDLEDYARFQAIFAGS